MCAKTESSTCPPHVDARSRFSMYAEAGILFVKRALDKSNDKKNFFLHTREPHHCTSLGQNGSHLRLHRAWLARPHVKSCASARNEWHGIDSCYHQVCDVDSCLIHYPKNLKKYALYIQETVYHRHATKLARLSLAEPHENRACANALVGSHA